MGVGVGVGVGVEGTPKIDRATRPFLKFDRATGDFLKFNRRQGYLRDKRQDFS